MKKFLFTILTVLSVYMYGQVPTVSTLSSNSDAISFWRNSDSLYQRYYSAITTSDDPSGLQSRMASIAAEGSGITNADADELAGYLGYLNRTPLKTISDSINTYLQNVISYYSISSLEMDAFVDSLGLAHGVIFPPSLPANNCAGAYNSCRAGASSAEVSRLNSCNNIPSQYRYTCVNQAVQEFTSDLIGCLGSYAGCLGGGGD